MEGRSVISVANLPPVATGGGNENPSLSLCLSGGCHHCLPFFKKKRKERKK
jgi:hypothetical protein